METKEPYEVLVEHHSGRKQHFARFNQIKAQNMSRSRFIDGFRLATPKKRQEGLSCNGLSIEAEYIEADDGSTIRSFWLCFSHRNWTAPAI
jgi:hypothetical protein